jgi:hypothetical protein
VQRNQEADKEAEGMKQAKPNFFKSLKKLNCQMQKEMNSFYLGILVGEKQERQRILKILRDKYELYTACKACKQQLIEQIQKETKR